MAPPVLLVVGAAGAGKSSLVQRLLTGTCEPAPRPSVGIESGMFYSLQPEEAETSDLRRAVPLGGVGFEIMEIGGREPVHREIPRGRDVCGLMVCYDSRDRTSFFRLWHVLCRHRMDRHMEISSSDVCAKGALAAVLCGTKADLPGEPAIPQAEVRRFAEANGLVPVMTSAHSGQGVVKAFQSLVGLVLEGEAARRAEAESFGESWTQRCFALPCGLTDCPQLTGMTSPPGLRPREPRRGIPCNEQLVEVLDPDGHVLCEPRTLAECLDSRLLHRAVHVWLCVPRTGALLLRKWHAKSKHPGLWGPSCHTEIRCYGQGDGHASEVSTQSAERGIKEQLGLDPSELGTLLHCFSCEVTDGNCQELLDVYLAPLSKHGLPALALEPTEEVDWAFFAHVLSPDFAATGRLFHYNNTYRRALARRLRDYAVPEDVRNAFAVDLDAELGKAPMSAAMKVQAQVLAAA